MSIFHGINFKLKCIECPAWVQTTPLPDWQLKFNSTGFQLDNGANDFDQLVAFMEQQRIVHNVTQSLSRRNNRPTRNSGNNNNSSYNNNSNYNNRRFQPYNTPCCCPQGNFQHNWIPSYTQNNRHSQFQQKPIRSLARP